MQRLLGALLIIRQKPCKCNFLLCTFFFLNKKHLLLLQKRNWRRLIFKQTDNQRIKFYIKLYKSVVFGLFLVFLLQTVKVLFPSYLKLTVCVWTNRKLFPAPSAKLPRHQCVDINLTHLTTISNLSVIADWSVSNVNAEASCGLMSSSAADY